VAALIILGFFSLSVGFALIAAGATLRLVFYLMTLDRSARRTPVAVTSIAVLPALVEDLAA
jgi:hypothetical protein